MRTPIIILIAAMAMMSCKNSQTSSNASEGQAADTVQAPKAEAAPAENSRYNPNDARTFGLVGPVQEVRYSKALLSTTST